MDIHELAKYSNRARVLLYETLKAHAEVINRPFETFSNFKTIRQLLMHMIGAEERWQYRLGGEPLPTRYEERGSSTLEEIWRDWEAIRARTLALIESRDPSFWSKTFRDCHLAGVRGVTPITTSQSYGVLIANGPTVSRPFTFRASGACGDTIIAILHLQDETRDLGSFQFAFRLGALGTPVTVNYSSGAINVPIPDLGRAEHTIVVPDTGVVSDVNVRVRLNHTYDGDLILSLIHPDGTEVILSNRRGGSGDNFGSGSTNCNGTFTIFDDSAATPIGSGSAPFAGRFRPDQSLSVLNGKPSNGNWTLRITDNAGADIGTLFCWQLEVTRQSPVCCSSPPPGDVNGDGCVNNADLRAVLAEFGAPESGSRGNTDLDNNGIVDDRDLAEVLSNFGNGC